jgi:hypothetical protein
MMRLQRLQNLALRPDPQRRFKRSVGLLMQPDFFPWM